MLFITFFRVQVISKTFMLNEHMIALYKGHQSNDLQRQNGSTNLLYIPLTLKRNFNLVLHVSIWTNMYFYFQIGFNVNHWLDGVRLFDGPFFRGIIVLSSTSHISSLFSLAMSSQNQSKSHQILTLGSMIVASMLASPPLGRPQIQVRDFSIA